MPTDDLASDAHRPHRWRYHGIAVGVGVAGLLITGVMSVGANRIHESNEDRLLQQRVRESASILSTNIATVTTPLKSAADLAEATDANSAVLEGQLNTLITAGQRFVSASVWRADGSVLEPKVVIGDRPSLETEPPAEIRSALARVVRSKSLTVFDLTAKATPALAYAVQSAIPSPKYIVYVERALPANRTALVRPQDAFHGLDNAVYLGDKVSAPRLLTASTPALPLAGRTAHQLIPFGDTQIRIEMAPRSELGGALMARLWWLLLIAGLVLTVASTALVERLLRRRDEAEQLATENRRLYAQQRNVALTLQRSLLPRVLPNINELTFAAYFEPAGAEGVDIGGDWYDAIAIDDDTVVFTVGDVSGRGLQAASIMASMRYAIRAFAHQGIGPARILEELGSMLDLQRDGHFATVVCGQVAIGRGEVVFASAGHPQPLLIGGGTATYAGVAVGPPIGLTRRHTYETKTVPFPKDMTILTFTDGLFERRGETIDVGLERLRDAADSVPSSASPKELLDVLRGKLNADPAVDDTAMLGVAWTS